MKEIIKFCKNHGDLCTQDLYTVKIVKKNSIGEIIKRNEYRCKKCIKENRERRLIERKKNIMSDKKEILEFKIKDCKIFTYKERMLQYELLRNKIIEKKCAPIYCYEL